MTNTIIYPQNPSIGDQFTVGGTSKEWVGTINYPKIDKLRCQRDYLGDE